MNATQNLNEMKRWLSQDALPLWRTKGIDAQGAFVEALSRDGQPLPLARRAMVQGRQIYSFVEAERMGLLNKSDVAAIVRPAIDGLLKIYSLPNGAFVHSANPDGSVANAQVDLYAQAFALFGLAQAYELLKDPALKLRALKTLNYLNSERAIEGGGYTELIDGKTMFEANPHMHLFEAVLEWMRVDDAPEWTQVAEALLDLCRTKFIDRSTGALCEHFDAFWKPKRVDGNFAWEPGHHFEWSWLMLQYEDLTGDDLEGLPLELFELAESAGVVNGLVIDEVWSNKTPKTRTARFWPQGERMKAAASLGEWAQKADRPAFARSADEGFVALFRYLKTPTPGLWEDTMGEDGKMIEAPAKASSLYHIINALAEYAKRRPGL